MTPDTVPSPGAAADPDVRIARTVSPDPRAAIREIRDAIGPEPVSALLFFADPAMDFPELAGRLHEAWGAGSIGCTTAGEIEPTTGHASGSLVVMAIRSPRLAMRARLFPDAASFDPERADREISPLLDGGRHPGRFGLLLVDGLSMAEELVAASVAHGMRGVPFVGGSAGDRLDFRRTIVACDGRAAEGAAVLGVVHTDLPFRVFQSHHFDPTETRLVITAADPARRRVMEINGEPAADGYARAVGVPARELTPAVFAAHPVLLMLGGVPFVRSIREVGDDGSLVFFCAIDEGLPLRIASRRCPAAELRSALDAIRADVGEPGAVIGFDCILRRLELESRGGMRDVDAALAPVPVVGFSTYGEQFNGLHVNQTLTGVAIGRAA